MEFVQIAVDERTDLGKGAVGRLRRGGYVPAVLYGLGRRTLPLTIARTEVDRFLRSGSHLVKLAMGDAVRQAIVREVQYDAISDDILHMDFGRVDENKPVETEVPIEFKGDAKGSREGGYFQTLRETLSVRARPADLPRLITIEVAEMEIGDVVHISDVALPDGVEAVDAPELVVCSVAAPKEEAPAEDGEEGAEGVAGAEPAPASE